MCICIIVICMYITVIVCVGLYACSKSTLGFFNFFFTQKCVNSIFLCCVYTKQRVFSTQLEVVKM